MPCRSRLSMSLSVVVWDGMGWNGIGWHRLREKWGRWRFSRPDVITYGTAQSSNQAERTNDDRNPSTSDTAVAEALQTYCMYKALITRWT